MSNIDHQHCRFGTHTHQSETKNMFRIFLECKVRYSQEDSSPHPTPTPAAHTQPPTQSARMVQMGGWEGAKGIKVKKGEREGRTESTDSEYT